MQRRTAHLQIGALALVTGLALAGCTGAAQPAGDTSTIRTTIDIPATFDPTAALSLPDFLLARTSYDTLLRRDESGFVPGLATEWTSTPTQAVFTIRDDATCSDGTVITPSIVKASLDYFARPDSPSVTKGSVFGPINTPVITADDAAGTVTIDVETPWPDLVAGLAISTAGIVCPAGLADPEGLAVGPVEGSESGPYVLKSFEAGVRYTYTLREDYTAWPEWSTAIDGEPAQTLEYVVSPDSTATANLIISGQLDIGKIQAQTIDRFDGMDGYEVAVNRFSDFYLIFNQREGSPFTDPAVRLGVAQALDRTMFENVTSLGTGEIATSLASSEIACVPADNPLIPQHDAAAAASVLEGISIRFIGPLVAGPAGAGNEYIAETLRAAGADVTIENTDVGSWVGTVFGEPDAWDLTMFADLNFMGSLSGPIGSFVGPVIFEGGGNIGAAANPAAEEAFFASLTAADEEERCGYLNEAVDALISNVDVFPLLNDPFIYAQRPGFSVTVLGGALDDPIFRITG
jgi:peptide/nickel transport system substrate-binding protein